MVKLLQETRSMARRAVATIAAVCTGGALCVAPAAAAPGAAPLKMNLDDFERARKTVALPNGMTLGYLEAGDPAGRPVVLIHGLTDSGRDWVALIPELDPSLRLIVVDLRGHGRSSKPDCCYGLIDFAYDIRLLLDTLAIPRADVVGHSLGSFVTQTFAASWPERTRRVVLISSSGDPRSVGAGLRTQFAGLSDPLDPDSRFMIEWWSSPTPVDAEFLRRQRRDAAAIPASLWLTMLDQSMGEANVPGVLRRLRAPALLIWGGKDPIFGTKDRRSLRAALPSAQVKLYPKLGHNPFWEDPEGLAAVINPFLLARP